MALTITLGDRTYEVHPLPLRLAREWRAGLQEPVGGLLELLAGSGIGKIDDVDTLVTAMREMAGVLINAPDTLWSLVLAYSPAIRADHEALEEVATSQQVVDAFAAILGVEFPLGRLMEFRGLVKGQTSGNSRVARGRANS